MHYLLFIVIFLGEMAIRLLLGESDLNAFNHSFAHGFLASLGVLAAQGIVYIFTQPDPPREKHQESP